MPFYGLIKIIENTGAPYKNCVKMRLSKGRHTSVTPKCVLNPKIGLIHPRIHVEKCPDFLNFAVLVKIGYF